MLVAVLFFGVCLLVGWHVATTNHGPMILLGMHLSSDQARMVFTGIAVVSAMFVILGVLAFFAGLFSSHRLTLTTQHISAPKYGFGGRVMTVPLADIQRIDVQMVKSHRFMNIYHRNGRLTVSQSFLPHDDAFEQVRSALSRAINF